MVMTATTAGKKFFAFYLEDAKTKVVQFDRAGKQERIVELPGIGSAFGFGGREDETEVYYTYTSFTTPTSIYRYDIQSGNSELYERPELDFDPDAYETKQVFYNSKDGVKIPMFIVHKKGLELNGKNPTYLYAYGGFNVSLQPGLKMAGFMPSRTFEVVESMAKNGTLPAPRCKSKMSLMILSLLVNTLSIRDIPLLTISLLPAAQTADYLWVLQ